MAATWLFPASTQMPTVIHSAYKACRDESYVVQNEHWRSQVKTCGRFFLGFFRVDCR